MKNINSQTILGILGSGQLARMTTLAASEFGIQTHIYCSESQVSPAEHTATKTIKGSFKDVTAILDFCQNCDVVTLENEFIDQDILEAIDAKFPDKLFPNSKTFKKIGDKISEKESFTIAGIKVTPFKKVISPSDVLEFTKIHGFPVVLKSAKGGYDGYGNVTIKSESELAEKFTKLKGELLVEAFIPYEKELAIMIARNKNREMVFYPVAHTMQENHICHFVSVPADVKPEIVNRIEDAAKKAMIAIDAVGIFAFEFFLTKEDDLYLNESAPRPHNSGHYTIEGSVTSQFHNHVRSVLNLPLGESTLRSKEVLMLNLLGTQSGIAELNPIQNFLNVEDGHLHLYGKKDSKAGRKMGHFTLLGNNKIEMFEKLNKLKAEYTL
ncbi:MAG: 5-(carboxyamino)imidazole ribonucleotide synthase [Rhizobacter sp.]|nr:5-(carboxyamino)imidazole ribonucleotide synthase [Bacteriovorax sp.]